MRKGIILAFFLALLLLAPAFSLSIESVLMDSWSGNSRAGAANGNGSLNFGGAVIERNATYVFNVSGFNGTTFTNLRFRRYSNESWATNDVAKYDYIVVENTDNSSKQVTNKAATSINYASGTLINNGSLMDINTSVAITQPWLLVTIVPFNATHSFTTLSGTQSAKQWGHIEYDPEFVVPTTSVNATPTSAWLPIDGAVSSSSLNSTYLAARVSALRGLSESFAVVSDSSGSRSAKSQVSSAGGSNPQLFLAALLNKTGAVFPTNPILVFQANDSFTVSAPLTKTYEAYGGGLFPVTWDRSFYSPSVAASSGGGTPVLSGFAEFQTQATTGGSPVDCYWWMEAESVSTKYRFVSACNAPTGSVSGTVRVYLRNSTDNSTVATVFSGASTFTDAKVNEATGYDLYFYLDARGTNYSVPVGPSTVGSFQLSTVQGLGASAKTSVAYSAGGTRDAVAFFGPALVPSRLMALEPYSGLGLVNSPASSSQAAWSGETANYLSYFGETGGIAQTAATFSFSSGAVTKGMTHLVHPPLSASVSYVCPSTVNVWAGVSVSVTCTDLVTNGMLSTARSPVTDDFTTSFSTGTFNSTLYVEQATSFAGFGTLKVTDLVGNVLPSALSSSSFSILRQSASANTTKQYKLLFTDGLGNQYTAYAQVRFVVGTAPSGAYGNNHRAVFVSYFENDTARGPLMNVTVNVSGALCTTAYYNATFSDNHTELLALCDIWVPDSLNGLNVTWTHIANVTSLNNTFFGPFEGAGGEPVGVADKQTASIYYWSWNKDLLRPLVQMDNGDCRAPEVKWAYSNENEYCTAQSCPVSSTISSVGGYSIAPTTYTCASSGQSSCFTESNGLSWKAVCSSGCAISASVCQGGCNSDNSACAGEAPGSGEGSASQLLSAFRFWGGWVSSHVALLIGIAVAAVVFLMFLALSAGLKAPYLAAAGSVLAGFIFIITLLITSPYGLLILVVLVLLLLIIGGFVLFKGMFG